MAKKSRTPPPPRRVQAPRARHEPDLQRRRTILFALAGSGLVMLLVVLGGLAFVGRDSGSATFKDPGPVMRAAGCTLRNYEGLSQRHVTSLNAKIKYNSFPPSSGPHYFQPAPWAFYDEPLSQVQVVHNLEHGGVAIQYGPQTPASTRDQIEQLYRDDPRGLIVAPLPALENKIALTAWTVAPTGKSDNLVGLGRVAKCDHVDEDAFKAFIEAYRFKGPESCLSAGQVGCYRPDDLEPGE